MAFEKISSSSFQNRSSVIAKIIVEKIQDGQYEVGSKLPPERVLAEQMGVGRPAIREAICALQIVGIVESRPGEGTYVQNTEWTSPNTVQLESSAISLLEEGDNPFEALEARRTIEADSVRRAAERRTDQDLEKIKSNLDWIVNSVRDKKIDDLLQADCEFHEAIAVAAKNTLVERMIKSLMKVMEQELWTRIKRQFLTGDSNEHLSETVRSHDEIYEAIKNQDSQKAMEIMERHFDEIERLFG